jgi:hypothetical protein
MRRRSLPVIWTTLKSTTCAGDDDADVAEGIAIDGTIAAGIMPADVIVGTGVTICDGIAGLIAPIVVAHPAVKRRPM